MEEFREFLIRYYGLSPTRLVLLEGYEDKTIKVETEDAVFVLKYQNIGSTTPHRIRLENKLTGLLAKSEPYDFPLPIPTIKGRQMAKHKSGWCRLLSFLEGTFLAEEPHTERLLRSLGEFLGRMNSNSMRCNPGHLAQETSPWDLQHLMLHQNNVSKVQNPRERALISYFLLQFETEVLPVQYNLRKGLIHNDANDWNVITKDGLVSGIIDFGDMCYSWLINELAVALTYVLLEKEDPLASALTVIKEYHRFCPLKEEEADILYYLIAGRMCMSLCNCSLAKIDRPESEYISISEAPVRRLLNKWIGISPDAARKTFLNAIGIEKDGSQDREAYLRRRKSIFPPSLSLSYKSPIVMRRAAFQYMFNSEGATFLDAYNNIMLVGHCHPKVVTAAHDTQKRLNTNTRYLYDELLDYGERLLSYFPPSLNRIFLVNSGSAATDLSIRLAKAHSGRQKMMALEFGYHGNTLEAISISHYKHREGELFPNTLVSSMPKVFGSAFEVELEAGNFFSHQARQLLDQHRGEVAGFIAEPIMGCGGQVPLPQGYLPNVYKAIREQGGLCISDEVQIGFGRLGHWNWGFEKYGVIPDMVILGKPMGNGHPLGAVITTEAIASVFDSGPEFFSSFGGNPVSCAIGLAVLEVLEEEGLRYHAARTGEYLKDSFLDLKNRFELIADVRGEGLFIGVELLDSSGNPGTRYAQILKNELRNAHILIGTDGPADNVLKIKPPLPFNRENSDFLVRETSRILKNLKGS